MLTILILVVVGLTLFATLLNHRFRRWLFAVGGSALLVGMAGIGFVVYGPKDYLLRWPRLVTVLHPYQVGSYSIILITVGGALLLGLTVGWLMGLTGSKVANEPK